MLDSFNVWSSAPIILFLMLSLMVFFWDKAKRELADLKKITQTLEDQLKKERLGGII